MTQSQKLRLYLASEKLVKPYTLCRASADFAATMGASLNEYGVSRVGRPMTKMARRAALLRAKKAGGEDRSGYGQRHVKAMHQAMFPGAPNPIEVVTQEFGEDLWQHLGRNSDDPKQDGPRRGDFVISISLDLSAVPATSSLRRWTNPVFHQVALWVRSKDNSSAYVLDGMAPYSDGMNGYWAPRAHIAKAAKAIEEGYVIAELYPVGEWTAERQMARKKNTAIASLETTLQAYAQANDRQKQTIEQLRIRRDELVSELASLQDSTQEQLDELQAELEACEAAGSLNREEVLDEAIQALEALK